MALLLWPARGLFAYTACALALYLLVVSVSLNKLAMYRRNVFLPFGGQKTADHLWRYLGLPYGVWGKERGKGNVRGEVGTKVSIPVRVY